MTCPLPKFVSSRCMDLTLLPAYTIVGGSGPHGLLRA